MLFRNTLMLLCAARMGQLACCGKRYSAPPSYRVHFPYKKIPTMKELITDQGYKYKFYKVTTEDGHILTLHRILPTTPSNTSGVPVLIVNGFAFQSDGWLALGESSLPFILTDMGYDVWLGDQRGSVRSLEHESYTNGDFRNHNYTFHEQGTQDLPTFIDSILLETKRSQLLYVGYSLSGGMMVVMNSERPEYNDKLLGAVLLAPAGHLRKWELYPKEYLFNFITVEKMIEHQRRTGLWLLFGNTDFVKEAFATCSFIINDLCRLFLYQLYGISDTMDTRTMFYQFATTVTSTSVFVGDHLFQVIKHGRFCKYDLGKERNLQVYGSVEPPNYLFNNTRIPILMMFSGTDRMVTTDAAKRTAEDLNVTNTKFIKRFNHADYLFSKLAPKLVYEDVVDYFDSLVLNAQSPDNCKNF